MTIQQAENLAREMGQRFNVVRLCGDYESVVGLNMTLEDAEAFQQRMYAERKDESDFEVR